MQNKVWAQHIKPYAEEILSSLEDKMEEAVRSAVKSIKKFQDSGAKQVILKTSLKGITDLGGFPKRW